jgi:thiosulfate/3-mercaptopyruvate sulfurtransferase
VKIQSKYLVETEWLADNLDDPNLVIIEANAGMPNYYEDSAAQTIEIVSGKDDYLKGHLPGADFVDLVTELSDRTDDSQFFPLPSGEQFAEAMSRHGIGEDVKVVIYDRTISIWACRFWLMIRSYGYDNVAVLNGGWNKWVAEGRPVCTELPMVTPRKFVVDKTQSMFATKTDTIEAMNSENICLINGLDPQEFAGHGTVRYSRPGHIPSSKNIPFMFLVHPETGEYLDREVVEGMFKKAGAFEKDSVVSYCGGAVGASSGVFLMSVLGVENVALYNGSLKEWADDAELPMVTLDEVEDWSSSSK